MLVKNILDGKVVIIQDIDIKQLGEKTEKNLKDLQAELNTMQLQFTKDITQLQTKAGVWGGILGALGGAIVTTVFNAFVKK